MYKEKIIDIPIYNGKICIINSDDKELIKKKHDFDISNEYVYAHTVDWKIKDTQCIFIIFNTLNTYKKITHGTIAHEALHMVNFLFDKRGVNFDADNDEPYAYMLHWVVDEIHKFIKIN